MNAIERLNKALAYFDDYKKTLPDGGTKDPVNAYIAEAKKRVKVEEKRSPNETPKGSKVVNPSQKPNLILSQSLSRHRVLGQEPSADADAMPRVHSQQLLRTVKLRILAGMRNRS